MLIGVAICVTEARADDVNGAAKAFSQAQQAMLANDYARAAEMYELADELAPSAPALRNAARARRAAGHSATAATLAAQILQRYSNDKESRGVAEAILSELAPKLTQVEVACSEPCTLSIDGKAASSTRPNLSHVLYAQPGARTIAAAFDGEREAKAQISAIAGGTKRVELAAPPKPAPVETAPAPTPATERPAASPGAPTSAPSPQVSRGIGRKWFVVAAAATVVLGTAATARGLATLGTRDDIEAATTSGDATRASSLYDTGRGQQLQTNLLLGATAVAAGSAIVLAVLADWSPGRRERREVAIQPTVGGAAFVLGGHF
ncbi:MAG TPA: hypothetical protein VM513_04345 [Kofleriaceae bacterium]|nr:hypothetical protein [Kofleriaceae bacterium]